MARPYVVTGADRLAFLTCRRAWDLGARERRNLAPRRTSERDAVWRSLSEALAVYYYPGMWDWPPGVVLPLVHRAAGPDPPAVLDAYLAWAPTVDDFAPVLTATELDAPVPDPRAPGRDLAVDGRPVQFRERIDALVQDSEQRYWLLEHRLVDGPWPDPDTLRLDDRCPAWCWAWEQTHPGMRVEGTIHNELRIGAAPGGTVGEPLAEDARGSVPHHGGTYIRPWSMATPPPPSGYEMRVQFGDGFRRVHVPRSRAELAGVGTRVAEQIREMTDPDTRPYPSPALARCTPCVFREPCLTLERGGDVDTVLDASFAPVDHSPASGELGGWPIGGDDPPRDG